jgi:lysine N6-hydroxylase
MTTDLDSNQPLDLIGVGIGPFNLSLAAMADRVPGLHTAFFECAHDFRWHPGLMMDGTTLQVPFLADLVSLVDPSNPWSFLGYLRAAERLFPFYFAERSHIYRAEYEAYCRWVSNSLSQCHFGHQVESITWDDKRQVFAVDYTHKDRPGGQVIAGRRYARHIVLGIGTEPAVPAPLRHLVETGGDAVLHSADYLGRRAALLKKSSVTVIGSGQSGAEVFLDLLRARPVGREGVQWISRSPAFAPMEYSRLGLEQFTPDYIRFFQQLPERTREQLLPMQWQLYKAISAETIAEIYDELYRRSTDGKWPDALLRPATAVRSGRFHDGRIELEVEHVQQDSTETLTTDAVVLATGYTERSAEALLKGIERNIARDNLGRPMVDAEYRLVFDDLMAGSVYVQNAERHTHGVGAPDLGLASWRSAIILNALTGREIYRLPDRTAFTTFGSHRASRRVPEHP